MRFSATVLTFVLLLMICGPSSAFLYDLCVKVDYAVGGGLYDYQNVYTLWGWYQLKWSPYVDTITEVHYLFCKGYKRIPSWAL